MTLPLRILAALVVALSVMLPVAASAAAAPSTDPLTDPTQDPSSSATAVACQPLDLMDRAAVAVRGQMADDVFLAQVASAVGPRQPSTFHVLVEEIFIGDLLKRGVTVELVSSSKGPGAGLTQGETYVFFTTGESSPLQADECDGYLSTKAIPAARIAELKGDLAPEERQSEVVISKPRGGGGDAPDLGRVVAPGGAISLIGILGLVLISRVGRQRL